MKVYDDDGIEMVQCRNCQNGTWFTECCNGSGGCDCQGQPVNMGTCNVCGGSGFHRSDANTMANSDAIRRSGSCFAGSGPTSGFWAGK